MSKTIFESVEEDPIVKGWLEFRPKSTQKVYGSALRRFCEFSKVTPEEFQSMDKKAARDLVWKYVRTLAKNNPSGAHMAIAALKSLYRNRDGETLSFDSRRGGKHYFNNLRKKKASYEHVPTKKEVYQIADMATTLRDRTVILVLFQSGIRVNALCSLNYGMVRKQLQDDKVPLKLRITDEIDTKLQGYSISFYDTFIGKEAIESLKKYCEMTHENSTDDTPLFLARIGKSHPNVRNLTSQTVWANFKKCLRRGGFDKKSMWTHSMRKAFKRVIRKSNIDQDFSEAIMGHVLPGSRENYFNRNDSEDIRLEYNKIDFSREGKSADLKPLKNGLVKQVLEVQALKDEIANLKQKLSEKEDRYEAAGEITDQLWKTIDVMKKEIEELKKSKQ